MDDIQLSSVQVYEQEGLRIPRTYVFTTQQIADRNINRASKLAKEGLISKAVKALDSTPPAAGTQETLEQLQRLHPTPSEHIHSSISAQSGLGAILFTSFDWSGCLLL